MSMVYLANVPSIASDNCVSFFTPYEHVAVDYPRGSEGVVNSTDYIVSSYYNSDVLRTNDFATAMDAAAAFLKQAEPA
jgi:hypothetical protein